MKQILYIGGFELPDKNAAAQRVMANAKLLKGMGYSITFLGVSKDVLNAPNNVNDFESLPVPYPTNTKQWVHHIFTFVDSSEILKRKPDYVVLYNFPAIASLRILRACHKHGIKVIHDLTEWESNNKWSPSDIMRKIDINLRMRYCTKKMDGVIAISKFLYEYYKNYTNTILVPPTVDLQDAKFNRARDLGDSSGITKVVYAGSPGVVASKDRLDYIISEVNSIPNVRLDIVGQTIEQYRAVFGDNTEIGNNVFFHGRVSHTEAIRFVCNADFQVLIRDNTLKNNAGFPTKFVESMSCCTPLIATVTSNILDYLEDGVNGFIVSKEHSLREVLRKVANMSATEKQKMKEACRACECFDYRSYRSEFSKIFK